MIKLKFQFKLSVKINREFTQFLLQTLYILALVNKNFNWNRWTHWHKIFKNKDYWTVTLQFMFLSQTQIEVFFIYGRDIFQKKQISRASSLQHPLTTSVSWAYLNFASSREKSQRDLKSSSSHCARRSDL